MTEQPRSGYVCPEHPDQFVNARGKGCPDCSDAHHERLTQRRARRAARNMKRSTT